MDLRHPVRLVLVGLGLGIAFDVLFNGKPPGISAAVFAVLLLGGLGLALRGEAIRPLGRNLWLPVALLAFAAMCAVRANGFLQFLNLWACLVLAVLTSVYLAQRPLHEMGLLGLLLAPVQAIVGGLACGGRATAAVARQHLATQTAPTRRYIAPVLRGLLLAVPILLVFTALLASADLVFAHRLEHLLSLEFLREIGRWIGHVLLSVAAGFLALGVLVYALRKRGTDWVEAVSAVRLPWFSGAVESTVLINLVNVLFGLFVLIQLPYLFGGQVHVVAGKFTYAEYARRGFGELVMVAILTLGLIVVLSAVTRREGRRRRLVFNLSSSVLVALTAVMLASAFKRLLIYELEYGFTRMRIYPHVFMVWLGTLLAWFAVTLWLKPRWFAAGALIAALGFVATLDVLNPDALVVRQNYRRAQDAAAELKLDVAYFGRLSEDAVPALISVAEQSTGKTHEKIEKELQRRLKVMGAAEASRPWQSFNLAHSRAYRLLLNR